MIVSATGLNLQDNFPMSTVKVDVDGVPYDPPSTFFFRACMLSDIPNFAFTFGYANSSWTLKADIVSKYVTDLLDHMEHNKIDKVCPRKPEATQIDEDKKVSAR